MGTLNDGSISNMYDGDAGSILRIASLAVNHPFSWPEYTGAASNFIENFKDCDARVVMCCFTEAFYDNMDPNSEVCHHTLEDSPRSNHIKAGMAVFDAKTETAYCTGFSWEEGTASESYAGNALFEASLKGGYWDRGYKKNIQSSPMCACVEKMPAVSHSDCIDVQASETFQMTIQGNQIEGELLSSGLSYGNCNGKSLVDHYAETATVEEVASLTSNHIVGNCEENTAEYLTKKFIIKGDKESPADKTKWEVVMGKGKFFHPPVGDTRFRELINASPNKIIYRHCDDCNNESRNIYYRRNTELPPTEYDFMNMFQNYWSDDYNEMGANKDFNLYSTYDDALAESNPWEFCNFNKAKRGFPRDCGKDGPNNNQYNNYLEDGEANNHVFMLRKPPAFKEKLKRRSRRVEVLTVWVGFVAGISKIGSNNMLFGNNVEILKII